MQAKFSKVLTFPGDSEEEIEFEVSFIEAGIGAYEFHGQRGSESHLEIDEITFDSNDLTEKQVEYINDLIDSGELDEDAWNAVN